MSGWSAESGGAPRPVGALALFLAAPALATPGADPRPQATPHAEAAENPEPEASVAPAHPAEGPWRLEDDRATLQARADAAIEHSLAELPFALKLLGRKILTPLTVPCDSYELRWTDHALELTCGDTGGVTVGLDGTPAPASRGGNPVTVVYDAQAEDRFTLTFAGPAGGQTTAFWVQGDHMTVTKSITADRLKTPVVWSIFYRRP